MIMVHVGGFLYPSPDWAKSKLGLNMRMMWYYNVLIIQQSDLVSWLIDPRCVGDCRVGPTRAGS